MKPTVGRIVHVTQPNSPEHLAAIVTYVQPVGKLGCTEELTTINCGLWSPRGMPTDGLEGVREDQSGETANSWHWPELEEEDEEEMELEEEKVEEEE